MEKTQQTYFPVMHQNSSMPSAYVGHTGHCMERRRSVKDTSHAKLLITPPCITYETTFSHTALIFTAATVIGEGTFVISTLNNLYNLHE
jgi:hypothetical protein